MAAAAARIRRAGPILASAVIASVASSAITPVVVHAEAPPKKSIYDDVPLSTDPPKRRLPSNLDRPTQELATYIRHYRLFLHDKVVVAQRSLDAAFDKYLSLEQSFTSTVASLAPSRSSGEQVLPGTIYVIVSAMAGGVVTRNRIFPIRAVTPLAAAVAASWVFLPQTTRNVADLVWKYEEKYPKVAEAHLSARRAVEENWEKGNKAVADGKKAIEGKLNEGRETIEAWIRRQ